MEKMAIFEKINYIFFVVAEKLIVVDTFHEIFIFIFFMFGNFFDIFCLFLSYLIK